ncbi:c-type cytochrome [Pigmentibacter ruber]|uniref:c-type cytochrome n=1 Tax=Pigmentibacter ruber TaxID=2683196 RepID=UPI00131A8867|nr:cytochrome c [Pigmentibacter ruber]BFD32901.1 hypothetical protein GTC16762_25190 [Pigmentibacter ruber]
MKAPTKVLLVSFLVTLLVVFIVVYRYDLIKMNKSADKSSETAVNTTSSMLETETATAAPAKGSGASAEQLANGKKFYESATCALCHGATGKADTPSGQAMKATNLAEGKFKNNKANLPPVKYIMEVIEKGVPGTGMASFKAQVPNEKDRKDLAEYVHSLSSKK